MIRFRSSTSKPAALAIASIALVAACGGGSSSSGSGDPGPVDSVGANSASIEPQRYRAWLQFRSTASTDGGATTPPSATDPAPAPAPTAPTPTTAAAAPTPAKMPYRGVNLSGAEFGSAIPGTFGADYTFPTNAEVDYYMGKGMNTFRVEFLWERLQPAANGALDATYASRLDSLVTYATSKGAHVVLNPQNFARYYGNTVGSAQVPNSVFADFWGKVSAKYASNPLVMFNLVNEPNTMPTEQWVSAANAAILGIRGAGATNTIIVPGNAWTGAGSWYDTGYGTPNAVAMLAINDPGDNVLYEAHLYMDSDASGASAACVSATVGSERLATFVKWLRDNHKKGFLGEFAGTNTATCNAAVSNLMTSLDAASDVMEGWLWWSGGPWWGEYQLTLEPLNGVDRPQMALLAPWLTY